MTTPEPTEAEGLKFKHRLLSAWRVLWHAEMSGDANEIKNAEAWCAKVEDEFEAVLYPAIERARLEAKIEQLKHWVKRGYIPDNVAATSIAVMSIALDKLDKEQK